MANRVLIIILFLLTCTGISSAHQVKSDQFELELIVSDLNALMEHVLKSDGSLTNQDVIVIASITCSFTRTIRRDFSLSRTSQFVRNQLEREKRNLSNIGRDEEQFEEFLKFETDLLTRNGVSQKALERIIQHLKKQRNKDLGQTPPPELMSNSLREIEKFSCIKRIQVHENQSSPASEKDHTFVEGAIELVAGSVLAVADNAVFAGSIPATGGIGSALLATFTAYSTSKGLGWAESGIEKIMRK